MATVRMPAEWEPHVATWLSWPHPEGISFPGSYHNVIPTFVKMVEILSESELVRINVRSLEQESSIRKLLSPHALGQTEFFYHPTNEPWCRDHGPIFVKENGKKVILDWDYNAWGKKYSSYQEDDDIPARIAEALQLERRIPGMVLEGGSIEVNGKGGLLTTTACLLNPNRNPTFSKSEIEGKLKEYLGVHTILWLGEGIVGDDTDGHIDDITRFVAEKRILTMVEPNSMDPNAAILEKNLELLREIGRTHGWEILEVPMPPRLEREGQRLPASYANYYIANASILLPTFGNAPRDEMAKAVLESCFPDRKVVGIDSRELIWGLGSFHCLTQQEPA